MLTALQITDLFRRIFYFFTFFILTFLAGFRVYGIDRDYRYYLEFFEGLAVDPDFETRFEPGFVLLAKLVIFLFGDDFSIFLLSCAAVSLYLKFFLIRKYSAGLVCLIIYFLILFPLHEMTQVRVSIAIGFAVIGIFFASRDNIYGGVSLRALSFILCGALFQSSVLVLLPFFYGRFFLRSDRFFLPAASLVVISFSMGFGLHLTALLNPLMSAYFDNGLEGSVRLFSSRSIAFILVIFFGALCYRQIDSLTRLLFWVSFFGLTNYFFLSWAPVFAHRFMEISIFPMILMSCRLPGWYRILSCMTLFVLGFYVSYHMVLVDPLFSEEFLGD